MIFDEFDQYSEDMLLSQYEISEIIKHEVTKGEVREDFLRNTLQSCSEPKPILEKGIVSDGEQESGQLDIILCRQYARVRRLGSHCVVPKSDTLCVIEVKGNCTGRDLRNADSQSHRIKTLIGASNPLYGVICYNSELLEKTIMNRFGFTFDSPSQTYYDNALLQNEEEINWQSLIYPNIDFLVSLEEYKKIFLIKYEVKPGIYRYVRYLDGPVIKHLFKLLLSLYIPTTTGVLD